MDNAKGSHDQDLIKDVPEKLEKLNKIVMVHGSTTRTEDDEIAKKPSGSPDMTELSVSLLLSFLLPC